MFRDTILVVDDDELVLEIVVLHVQHWGWRVIQANSLDAASALLRTEIARVAAVISDDHMGGYGLNGSDLYNMRSLDFTLNGIPFFLMTGSIEPGFAQAARDFGMHVVFKPINFTDLRGRVRDLAQRWPAQVGGTEL
jgi:DNA-binding response OmpR family regulator